MFSSRASAMFMLTAAVLMPLAVVFSPAAAAKIGTDDQQRLAQRRTPVVEVFENTRDAVVNISSTQLVTVRQRGGFFRDLDDMFDRFFDDFWPRQRGLRRSVGSGFVIHPRGFIVTNAHVVARAVDQTVTFADGREYEAEIVAADVSRDLALLRVKADETLPTITLGRSDDLLVGETVIAIGNPLGYQHTVTSGVISATGRDLRFPNDVELNDLIQTDASINPGNSGGPLLNVLGELIGINTAIRGDAQNIGFAIPVDQLREAIPELLDIDRRERIRTGLRVDTFGRPRVIGLVEDSPAHRAGIEPGDALIAIDGRQIESGIDYYLGLLDRAPDESIRLTIERDSRRIERSFTPEKIPMPDGRELAQRLFGIQVQTMEELRGRGAGLVITQVERGSPADRFGMQRGDVLLEVGGHHITTLDQLGLLLEQVEPGSAVPITIRRTVRQGFVQTFSGRIETRSR